MKRKITGLNHEKVSELTKHNNNININHDSGKSEDHEPHSSPDPTVQDPLDQIAPSPTQSEDLAQVVFKEKMSGEDQSTTTTTTTTNVNVNVNVNTKVNESSPSQTPEKLPNNAGPSPNLHPNKSPIPKPASFVTVNHKPGNYVFKKNPNYNKSKEELKLYSQSFNAPPPPMGIPSLFQTVGNYHNNYDYLKYKNTGKIHLISCYMNDNIAFFYY